MTPICALSISLSSLSFKLMLKYLWRKGKLQLLPTSVAQYFKNTGLFSYNFHQDCKITLPSTSNCSRLWLLGLKLSLLGICLAKLLSNIFN